MTATVFYTLTAVSQGYVSIKGPLYGKVYVSLGNVVLGMLLWIYEETKARLRNNEPSNPLFACFRDYEFTRFLALGTVANSAGMYVIGLGFYFAIISKINQGILSSLLSLNAPIIAIYAWRFFNEKISAVRPISCFS